ncbi:MAG: hypothetical protein IJ272_11080 [Clostridia bacterium]|nr:hypothetical protein [Clostridia bacterium]
MDYVTQIIEYIDSLAGQTVTPELLRQIQDKRKEYLNFLEQKSLITLLDVTQPKTMLQWDYASRLLTPLYAFDCYINQSNQVQALNQIKDKQTTRNMCEYDKQYIEKYRNMP